MKKKIQLLLPAIISSLSLLCFCSASYAQTADNSIKISGGEFGSGQTFVFPDEGKAMNQAFYHATSDKRITVQLNNNEVKYKGKEISLGVLINLKDPKGAGIYKLAPKFANGDVAVQIGADEGIAGHVIASITATVNLTAFGGKGTFAIGTFSGNFFEVVDGKKIDYQVSGKFKVYRIA